LRAAKEAISFMLVQICRGRMAVAVVVLSLATRASAQDTPPETPQATPAPTQDSIPLEERVKQLEEQLRKLTAGAPQPAQPPQSPPPPATPATSGEPFAWGDFSWLNGQTRQTEALLATKYFMPQLNVDVNYTYSFNRPIDNVVAGSTALARNNELELSFLGIGGDVVVGQVRGRLMLQYGTRTTVVPRNDNSTLRGQFDLATIYRYLSEAYAGYHWNKMHGINLDVGLFMSYVGLFSYDNFENWAYVPSYTSDNTPWFFNGARLQLFPTDRFKFEIWLINGWQTYGKFNELPGLGYQIDYRPYEWMKFLLDGYVGTDTQDHPGRVRFHSDNSILIRYYNHPNAKFLSRAALSVTFDLGFEGGDVVAPFHGLTGYNDINNPAPCTNTNPCEQDFVSAMAYNRLWFDKNIFGWTVGGGFLHNPGRYLPLVPPGYGGVVFSTNPGTSLDAWDVSTTFDWMPSELITWRFEFVHRASQEPYFNGRGGVTGPDGYKTGGLTNPDGQIISAAPPGWTPDLVTSENRLVFALIFRLQ
jgi:hypothetical protein